MKSLLLKSFLVISVVTLTSIFAFASANPCDDYDKDDQCNKGVESATANNDKPQGHGVQLAGGYCPDCPNQPYTGAGWATDSSKNASVNPKAGLGSTGTTSGGTGSGPASEGGN